MFFPESFNIFVPNLSMFFNEYFDAFSEILAVFTQSLDIFSLNLLIFFDESFAAFYYYCG
jgi:hypothetical protein